METYLKLISLNLLNLFFVILFNCFSPSPLNHSAGSDGEAKADKNRDIRIAIQALLQPRPDLQYKISCRAMNSNTCNNYFSDPSAELGSCSFDPSIVQLNTFCSSENVVGVCFLIDKNNRNFIQAVLYSPTYTTASASTECQQNIPRSMRSFFMQSYTMKQSYSVAEIDALR